MLILYSVNIFVSALLLFLVQPMFTRMALPYLGGTPAVWNTAQVFFQAALLAGYGFAHASIAKLGPKRQAVLQLGVLLLPLLVLPIAIPHGWRPPTGSNPIPALLGLLLVAVGLPFFAISTSSPVLQKWFAASKHAGAQDPYFLYAASNLGSMLALLAYPVLVEPNFTLSDQSRLWAGGYLLLILLTATSAAVMWRLPAGRSAAPARPIAAVPVIDEPISAKRRARWILLAFVPSSLMLSVTTYLQTDVASIPLLWIIPLSLYLLSFIIVFARGAWRGPSQAYASLFAMLGRKLAPPPHRVLLRFLPFLVLPLVLVLATETFQPLLEVMPLHLLAFFSFVLLCHGEIARDRPPASRLTEFYLWMAVGGVAGGIFNALLAPVLFKTVAEYPITVALACLLMPRQDAHDDRKRRLFDFLCPAGLGVLALVLYIAFQHLHGLPPDKWNAILYSILALVSFAFSRRPIRFGLAIAVVLATSFVCANADPRLLATERSFFGVHRVTLNGPIHGFLFHQFIHGNILHGQQNFTPGHLRTPLAYYYTDGPIGQVFSAFSGADAKRAVGVVGLGTGTLAVYAQPGQQWTFYEIDPQVERIARDPRLFTYLRDCRAPFQVTLGDARLSLGKVPDGCHDLLILDAYSSDSIPIHLVTREAFQVYLRALAPHGMLAFHITNRHVDLEPVLAALAKDAGLVALDQTDNYLPPRDIEKSPSRWMLIARATADFGPLAHDARWHAARLTPGTRVWTDDYSSILSVFHWG